MSSEMAALQRSLDALLEHRAALRKDYVDRDRELGSEIKGMLARIRELEESVPTHEEKEKEKEQQVEKNEVTNPVEPDLSHARRKRARYDYQTDVVPFVVELLSKNGKMKSAEIMRALHERHNLIFSNPTIAMNRIMAEAPAIQKIDGYYTLQASALTK